jgi:hypothetical protein
MSGDLWPPLPPDLTPPDFFFCGGYLKDWLFCNKPHKIDALKVNITNEITHIDSTLLRCMTNKL